MFRFTSCDYVEPRIPSLEFIIPRTITHLKIRYDPIYVVPSWLNEVYFDMMPSLSDLSDVAIPSVMLRMFVKKQNIIDPQHIILSSSTRNMTVECSHFNIMGVDWNLDTLIINTNHILSADKIRCVELRLIKCPIISSEINICCDHLILESSVGAEFILRLDWTGLQRLTILYDMKIEWFQRPPIPVRIQVTEHDPLINRDLLISMQKRSCEELILLRRNMLPKIYTCNDG